ncbi:MAG: hypothetical protein ACR2QO_22100 [Acidimicrobiales bacterium]
MESTTTKPTRPTTLRSAFLASPWGIAGVAVFAVLFVACSGADNSATSDVEPSDPIAVSTSDDDPTDPTVLNTTDAEPSDPTVVTTTDDEPARVSIRDLRYCEIFPVFSTSDGAEAAAYNTFGLNNCPQDEWEAIDLDEVISQVGDDFATRNGPRYWTMDFIVSKTEPKGQEFFGTLEMRHGATVQIGASAPPGPYSGRSVERDTEFHFYGGTPVFELIDPDGNVYVMQSYSVQQVTDQSFADLASLDERISLPDGWQFRTRTLIEDLIVEDIDGIATVVQDDFQNTYQLTTLTPDSP